MMKKALSSNQILCLLLIVTWLSHSMYLYPLPSYRLSQTQEQFDEKIPEWVGEDKKDELQNQHGKARNLIWIEWIFTLALCGIGILAGIMCWQRIKYWRAAAFTVVSIYVLLWFLRYAGNPNRSIIDTYLYQLELAKHLGGIMPLGNKWGQIRLFTEPVTHH